MSVKNCSSDVLVSRNSSQIALDESASNSAWKRNLDIFFFGMKFLLLSISRLVYYGFITIFY